MATSVRTIKPPSIGREMSLRARLILGYGIVVSLTLVFGLFTLFHLRNIRDRLETLSADVTVDTRYSIEAVTAIADAQRAVDRYLQQPNKRTYQDAERQLDVLQQTIERLERDARNLAMSSHLRQIGQQAATYRQIFNDIHASIVIQQRTRDDLYTTFSQQHQTIEEAITNANPTTTSDYLTLMELSRASAHLQLAYVWIGRMHSNDTRVALGNALAELRQARTFLRLYLALNSALQAARPEDIQRLQSVSESFDRSIISVIGLADSYIRTEALISSRLKPHATQMSREATALSDTALMALSTTTADIDRETERTQVISVGVLAGLLMIGAVLGLVLASLIARPLSELVSATTRLARGDEVTRIEPRGGRELILLAQAFNDMAAELERERAEVRHQNALLAERAAELEQTLRQLREETAAREQLRTVVRQMSVPIIPIMEGVLVAPLVGEIDAERAELLQQRLLNRIVAERAQVAILDITGVPIVDAQIGAWLIQATAAARLLGARCILVGINPEVSQALVSSGIDLGNLVTRATLREGLEYAMRIRREASGARRGGNGVRQER
ncbi:MAG: HAMP domain-containing protein [Roseiflexus sp.]|nr:HAMP domain-containing protein [Roseiflexus sp.]